MAFEFLVLVIERASLDEIAGEGDLLTVLGAHQKGTFPRLEGNDVTPLDEQHGHLSPTDPPGRQHHLSVLHQVRVAPVCIHPRCKVTEEVEAGCRDLNLVFVGLEGVADVSEDTVKLNSSRLAELLVPVLGHGKSNSRRAVIRVIV